MGMNRDFKLGVAERLRRDPAFASAMLEEASALLLEGDALLARASLQTLVDATLGFDALARATAMSSDQLWQLLSAGGNPRMNELAAIFGALRQALTSAQACAVFSA